MSPLPTSFSAPGWSRMTRLSVRLDTANATRAGMLALITPVITLTLGRWVATIRWMPTARAFWAMRVMRLLDVAGRHHHQVVELVDDDDDVRQPLGSGPVGSSPRVVLVGSSRTRGRRRRPAELAAVERGVVAGDVPEADLEQQVVAALHLLHGPPERVGRLLRVGDGLREQVGQPVVLAHLDLLGVDQDQAHLLGRGAHQQRGDDAVDAARLAGARRPGDEQVGRGRQVEEDGPPGDVLADRDLERVGGLAGLRRRQQVAERRPAAGCGWAPRRRSPSGRGSAPGCARRSPPWRRRCPAAGVVTRATLTPAPSSSS